jgi:hypothetical protein
MKRILAVVSLALIVAAAAQAQPRSTEIAKADRLSRQQLNSLIVTAKTPADHERIAQAYESNARQYRAEAQEHEAMIATYKAHASLSNDKNRASTIGHCEYLVKALNDLALKSDELARRQQEMAREAGQK